ncbi:MAG: hypothetical protein RL681_631 [Candidatus Parcubacteria bacterium]|jgi:hypothetical protein
MPYRYAYITGCSILLVFWLLVFLKRKNLRRELLWASLWGLPFGFIDYFLVPTYWNPDSLFGLIQRYGVGIESFVFLFAMTGIASVIYDFVEHKEPVKASHSRHSHYYLLFSVAFAYVAMSIMFPQRAIYNLMIAGAVGAAVVAYFRRDLWKHMCVSACMFSVLYFGVFVVVSAIFKGFVEHAYDLRHTWGILVLGVPLEEIGVAFFAGAFWSVIYEYTKAYRERNAASHGR